MKKYSTEFKMKIVQEYLNEEGGYKYLTDKYGLSDHSVVRRWVNSYKTQGYEGLKISRKNNSYSFEFKKNVVKLYLTGEMSYQELSNQFKINSPAIIARWVIDFRNQGLDGLRPKKKGRPSSMTKDKNKEQVKKEYSKEEIDEIAELKDKLYWAQMEIDFLKKKMELEDEEDQKERMARIIDSLREKYLLKDLLNYLKFPKSTYMYWKKRFDRKNKDEAFENQIKKIRKDNPNYGYRRIHAMLRRIGLVINKKKVQRLVQKLKLQVRNFARKSRKYYSYKGTVGKVAPNRIKRRFNTSVVHQKITTDTSEFKYYETDKSGNMQVKKLYLNPFLDMFNGEIISYSITTLPSLEAIIRPLEEAIEKTSDCKYKRIFHSDQGWAYQLKQYTNRLESDGILQSMSRKGNCLDNSPMENFFGILKQEIYYGRTFKSFNELKKTIEEYIKYYNEDRIKEKLGYLSPVEYRKLNAA
ncbi:MULTISPECIES: IS3 family transposase [Bacillota]|uniref:IS3 family transposase n=1 Tax=Bacillota TaxID=1239 RepID=UPI0012B0D230|nr:MULTISPECIES: IS3 family transposase [Bacillota]MSB17873.1 IS3 family transposase [Finegoldia magna]MSD46613.1 IS3 family transposase [Finegoldia magna]MTT81458.1 IS3 family transposase [Phascolarctobacterium faecium]